MYLYENGMNRTLPHIPLVILERLEITLVYVYLSHCVHIHYVYLSHSVHIPYVYSSHSVTYCIWVSFCRTGKMSV